MTAIGGNTELRNPHDLLITYASEPMAMWPISRRVNKPENDDPSLLDRVTGLSDVWAN
jgi:putative SOS response-associated peptidase YedK